MVLALLSGAHRPKALQDAAACPQALGPHHHVNSTRARRSFYRPAAASPRKDKQFGRLRRARSPMGRWLRTWRLVSCRGRDGSSHLRFVSVSVVPLGVASWGVVRPGERRLRACRCSRGHRPSGSESEPTDRRATLPQRHPNEVGGPLTRTRLRRACRLQRPSSLLMVRPNRG